MKRLNPKNKGKRNTAESSHGSGDTIDKTNPVDKKCFSVKTIDVNQDLMLSDEDEDSEDDQKFSPTKSFKAKRNRIEDEDLVEENPASLKNREKVGATHSGTKCLKPARNIFTSVCYNCDFMVFLKPLSTFLFPVNG